MGFNYSKALGQNFIYDLGYLRGIVKKLGVKTTDTVVEVGTGAGTLTKVLAETGCQVQTYEIDRRLETRLNTELKQFENVKIVWGDALQHDLSNIPDFRLIANVPYYITTPLISKFLTANNCLDINILVADEVANRIVAPVGTSEYGALSVACQLVAECRIIQQVPRSLFTPVPKVDSAFISLVKRKDYVWDHNFGKLLKAIFAGRRKTILNALSRAINQDKETTIRILTAVGIDVNLRPEQINPTEYGAIWQIMNNFDK